MSRTFVQRTSQALGELISRQLGDLRLVPGVQRFVHVSIVGLEGLKAMPYPRRKLKVERLVRDAPRT